MEAPEPTTPQTRQRRTTRSSSFQDKITPSPLKNTSHTITSQTSTSKNSSTEKWTSAEGFFNKPTPSSFKTPMSSVDGCRSSIAKIRSQNAGMVLAKARLFDEMLDSDSSNQKSTSSNNSRPRPSLKIGSVRHVDRQNNRIRTLRVENRLPRKSMSPRRRALKSPTNRNFKLQLAKAIRENNEDLIQPLRESNRLHLDDTVFCTPKHNALPHIKKSLAIKSPKRLNKTPLRPELRQTPLKAVTPRNTDF